MMMMVFCTFPDQEKAREVATEIIAEGLAACVNILPGVESIYRWEGEILNEQEALTIFKVAAAGFQKLEKAIVEKHPYDTPEIVGIAADKVSEKYLSWVVGD
jgi:uncharacterized protein involved in tolerance to divalent cations